MTVPAIPSRAFRVLVSADDLTLGLILRKENQNIYPADTILVVQKLAVRGSQSLSRAVCVLDVFAAKVCIPLMN